MDEDVESHAGQEDAVYVQWLLFSVDVGLGKAQHYVDHDYSAHFIEDLKFLHQRLCKGLCPQQVDNLNG